MIWEKNRKMRDQIEVKTFFLEITMSLGKIRKIRDQSSFF